MRTERDPTGSALIAVMLVGATVIAGWHLHIPAFVQLIPGTIPMQYNTALCFLVLGAASYLCLIRRVRSIWLIAGGLFVGLMGSTNLLQYATGKSFGVDTALFYPWDLTLTVHPGRMAIPTAICFFSTGVALVLLARRPGAITLFAIGQVATAGLGLVSLSAYLTGNTNLSLFGFGIQMAVHTALAFIIYAAAMLTYAWRRAPSNEEGFPKWSPVITMVGALSFSIGLGAATQDSSGLTRVILLFVSMVIAVPLVVAVHKLTQLRMAYKGLVLISIPILFSLAFVLVALQVRRSSQESEAAYLQSKEVIAKSQSLLSDLLQAQSGLWGYVITGNPEFASPYYRAAQEAPDSLRHLQFLVRENLEKKATVDGLAARVSERLALLAELELLMRQGNHEAAIQHIKSGVGERVMYEFRSGMSSLIEEEERLDLSRREAVEASWRRFNWLMVAGVSAVILLALMLVLLFDRGIAGRLRTLTENARALAGGEELASPMTGTDEIARLDQVFHSMAGALADAARKERALVHNALDLICCLNADGRFVRANPAAIKVLGYTPEELVGRHYSDLVIPDDLTYAGETMTSVINGREVSDFETRCVQKNGSIVNILWSASWSAEDRLMFCVARDITQRKTAEEKITRLNERMKDYAARLEETNQELESFCYSVSHDLRSPLRHIDGFSELLQKDAAAGLDDKSRRYLTLISDSAKRMGRLIDDLLAFSRVSRAEIRKSPVSVEEVVDGVKRDLEKETEGRIIKWKISSLPEANADPAMMRLVMTNLLSNAVKYTRLREEAEIEIGARNGSDEETVYFVRDNGVGFEMRYVDKLFGVFQRLHRAEEFEGTGIGLANVRRIITRHGGRTWANGAVGAGATFYFSLPGTDKR